ncbi:hypothetical protein NDU88_008450 [Pleurodeles waltl]|uniref:Uncharacterized protein n=1 Tax=Pleurodeles waltl TaxID=8319 RepID=A0AAV7PQE8_PLEWA|nr:hypothetical protein NDU88_008450 [Pleurodeles waltl]
MDTIKCYLSINDTSETSLAVVWEALKAVVRGQFIAIAARANTLRKEKRRQLEARIKEMEGQHSVTGAKEVKRQLAANRKQLKALDMDGAEHAPDWVYSRENMC